MRGLHERGVATHPELERLAGSHVDGGCGIHGPREQVRDVGHLTGLERCVGQGDGPHVEQHHGGALGDALSTGAAAQLHAGAEGREIHGDAREAERAIVGEGACLDEAGRGLAPHRATFGHVALHDHHGSGAQPVGVGRVEGPPANMEHPMRRHASALYAAFAIELSSG